MEKELCLIDQKITLLRDAFIGDLEMIHTGKTDLLPELRGSTAEGFICKLKEMFKEIEEKKWKTK